ncbi:AAA family ATPase, partial [bacterium]|nr:AAA family ATPase [bacterium]
MLNQLHIKNFAIIDDLTINFTKGFNVLTGETGAGKTIIIEALNLVLGCRANTEMIRGGESQASVTAVFDLSSVSNLVKRILSEKGIDNSDELIIKRVISSDSKNKAFINGEAYPQQAIKEIALYLVDISSQHNQQSLLDDTSHIFIVDDFGKLEDLRSQYEKIYYEFIS